MLNTTFPPWPKFSKQETDAVSKVLLSNKVNYWTGQEGKKFEQNFAQFSDCQYAVAVANGTLALELALKALDIGQSDEVIVSPRSFIASVSCVVAVGAIPVFSDVDINSGNISVAHIKSVITSKTKAIICVHLAGFPCEMHEIMVLAKQHHIKVIEDCAQAHGAKYKGQSVGSIGHIGAWSFCQDKIMTTGGEGGMVTTNDKMLYERMWSYKDHGKSYYKMHSKNQDNGFRFVHDSFGSNYRLTEMQAVIGNIQLTKILDWHNKRIQNANEIWQVARQFSALSMPNVPKYSVHACYKAYILVDELKLKSNWITAKIREAINVLGVPCYTGTCREIYQEEAFKNTTFLPKKPLINAQSLSDRVLMFLVHPTLTPQHIKQTTQAIITIMNQANA